MEALERQLDLGASGEFQSGLAEWVAIGAEGEHPIGGLAAGRELAFLSGHFG